MLLQIYAFSFYVITFSQQQLRFSSVYNFSFWSDGTRIIIITLCVNRFLCSFHNLNNTASFVCCFEKDNINYNTKCFSGIVFAIENNGRYMKMQAISEHLIFKPRESLSRLLLITTTVPSIFYIHCLVGLFCTSNHFTFLHHKMNIFYCVNI
jgi:hypothetical protein